MWTKMIIPLSSKIQRRGKTGEMIRQQELAPGLMGCDYPKMTYWDQGELWRLLPGDMVEQVLIAAGDSFSDWLHCKDISLEPANQTEMPLPQKVSGV